jgi:hypothetical protein
MKKKTFPTIFLSLVGLIKSRCDNSSGTSQRWVYFLGSKFPFNHYPFGSILNIIPFRRINVPKWLNPRLNPYYPPWYLIPLYPPFCKKVDQQNIKVLPYLLYEKDINPNAHIEVFKCIINPSEETQDYHIVNMFQSTLKYYL